MADRTRQDSMQQEGLDMQEMAGEENKLNLDICEIRKNALQDPLQAITAAAATLLLLPRRRTYDMCRAMLTIRFSFASQL